MTDPILYDSKTPRLGLPLLFAGQAQKETFLNEALAMIDSLLHCSVEGTLEVPPADPAEGSAWLVGDTPSGEWSQNGGAIALRQSGNWLFAMPREGMRIFDRSTGSEMRFTNSWQSPVALVEPSGGTTVDAEARAVIGEILAALRTAGIIPGT